MSCKKINSIFLRRCDLSGVLCNLYGLRSWCWQLRFCVVRQLQWKFSVAHNRVLRMYRSVLRLRFEEVSVETLADRIPENIRC